MQHCWQRLTALKTDGVTLDAGRQQHRPDLVILNGHIFSSCLDLCLKLLTRADLLLLLDKLPLGNELLQGDSRLGRGLPGGEQGGLQLQAACDACASFGPCARYCAAITCWRFLNGLGLYVNQQSDTHVFTQVRLS